LRAGVPLGVYTQCLAGSATVDGVADALGVGVGAEVGVGVGVGVAAAADGVLLPPPANAT
jgi:hypothetical protein